MTRTPHTFLLVNNIPQIIINILAAFTPLPQINLYQYQIDKAETIIDIDTGSLLNPTGIKDSLIFPMKEISVTEENYPPLPTRSSPETSPTTPLNHPSRHFHHAPS